MLPIEIPFRQFFDLDGKPLDGGYVYIGEPSQNPETAPITVYWDVEGTQPAAQPIRTLNGYAVRNGTLAIIYTPVDYSITVLTKKRELVYYAATSVEFDPNTSFRNLSNTTDMTLGVALVGGAGRVVKSIAALRALPKTGSKSAFVTGYYADGDGGGGVYYLDAADTTTVDNGGTVIVATDGGRWKLVQSSPVSVKQFGAKGDGTTNDRAAIQTAFNASKRVRFPAGTYFLGSYATGDNIIDLSALGDGVSIITDKSVEFLCTTTAAVVPRIFYLKNNNHFTCGPVKFRDTGYVPTTPFQGAAGFYFDGENANWGDVCIEAIYGKNMVACAISSRGSASHRIRGINIGMIFSDDCYYGYNGQDQGDGVNIDNLIAYQNYRPYFVYGVTGHKVKVFNRAARTGSGAINISRSVGGLNTSDIDLKYTSRDNTLDITHVLINHQDLLGGEISNIDIKLDIRSSVIYTPVRFVNYTGAGGTETSSESSNKVYDVAISGSCDGQASPITAVASYADKRLLKFRAGQHLEVDQAIRNLFYFDQAVRSVNIGWTAASVNPSIGNGSLSGSMDVVDGMAFLTVSMDAGSTTSFGSGEWYFGLPYEAKSVAVGSLWILDAGNVYHAGIVKIEAGTKTAQLFINGLGVALSSNSPMVWAAGDKLKFSIAYPVA